VPIFLIRHAHARTRSRRDVDDSRRLSTKGRVQAGHVRDLLADRPVGRLFSSPSRRCVETLEPLAQRTGLSIETVDALQEGATGAAAERFLRAHAAENPVACTHGDVIPLVMRRLRARGMAVDTLAAKGSVWVLDLDDWPAVTGTYHPPAD
jgi:broad specificity phosphatase PhoE